MNRGFSTIEALLSSTILILIVTAFMGAYIYGSESTALAGQRARATMLADEGLEATRSIRNLSFANLSNGNHGVGVSGGIYTFLGVSDTTDIFTRNIAISDLAANRKQVVSTVNWTQNLQRSGSVVLTTELASWQQKVGNWTIPIEVANIDLSGGQSGLKIQVQGNYAYITRGGNVPNFLVIDTSNPASPVLVGSVSLPGIPQNLVVSGNFAYIASAGNTQELQIVNITNPAAPSLTGTYNAPGNANMNGVSVVGNTAYIVRTSSSNNEFLAIDVSDPALPVLLGSLDLGSDGNDVITSGNYAYVASSDNSQELKVINISNPILPLLAGSLNLPDNTDADSIALAGTTVFLSQGSLIYTIGIGSPTAPSQLGSIDVGGKVIDIALNLGNSNTYLYITARNTSAEFQVIDITSLSSPTLLGSLNIAGTNLINGTAYDSTLDRAFAVGDPTNKEFIVIAPQ